ncbi:MAG: hypothetical protein OEZ58_15635 [Gammaproteobacteria bacterium]|nr:hypothetical protein [Gammaproteobacteria bacterium]
MKRISVLLVVISFLFVACGSESPLKPGYAAISIDDVELVEKLKLELKNRNIEHYTYVSKNIEFVAYRKTQKELIDAILNRAKGGPPIGYTGLCYETEKSAEKKISQLSKIDVLTKNEEKDGYFCVYWEKKNVEKVEKIDSNYRDILEHQRSK